MTELRPNEYELIRKLAYEKCGLDFRSGKEEMIAARIGKQIRDLKFENFRQYYNHVIEDQTGEALTHLIDALTTNYTSFFREPAHFEFLRKRLVPRLRTRERIEVWSAACSTGEEPYSVAFCLREELGRDAMRRVRILATDISTKALGTARKAVYPAERLEGIREERLREWVLRGEGTWQGWYRVRGEIREAVEFGRMNLMEALGKAGQFPLIFCRNVMIYFDQATQRDLVRRLAGCLEPGGYLFIGHSESLAGTDPPLDYVQPAVYRKPEKRER